ncbi:MAG: hypothetical protein ACHQ7N_12010 [Candidatus Methylomirabilales bacterium]
MRSGPAGILWMTILAQGAVALAGQSPAREERIREAGRRVEQVAAPLGEAEATERPAAVFRVQPQTVLDLDRRGR